MTVISLGSHRSPSCVYGPVPGWSAGELTELAGITYRQLDYWTRTGVLETLPSYTAPGSGYQRFYSTEEVEFARRMRILLDAGLALHVAGPAARAMTRNGINAVQLTEDVCLVIGSCA